MSQSYTLRTLAQRINSDDPERLIHDLFEIMSKDSEQEFNLDKFNTLTNEQPVLLSIQMMNAVFAQVKDEKENASFLDHLVAKRSWVDIVKTVVSRTVIDATEGTNKETLRVYLNAPLTPVYWAFKNIDNPISDEDIIKLANTLANSDVPTPLPQEFSSAIKTLTAALVFLGSIKKADAQAQVEKMEGNHVLGQMWVNSLTI